MQLQRILLLRELGIGLSAIADIVQGQQDVLSGLRTHLELLETERRRIVRQIASVRTTLHRVEEGEQLMPQEAFDGFDHTQFKEEVTQRWGRDACQKSDRWWRSLSEDEKEAFQRQALDIAKDFGRARVDGKSPDSDEVQAIAHRQVEWLSVTTTPTKDYVIALGEMYVNDTRFTATYDRHGPGTAVLVRDGMKVYAERNLSDHRG